MFCETWCCNLFNEFWDVGQIWNRPKILENFPVEADVLQLGEHSGLFQIRWHCKTFNGEVNNVCEGRYKWIHTGRQQSCWNVVYVTRSRFTWQSDFPHFLLSSWCECWKISLSILEHFSGMVYWTDDKWSRIVNILFTNKSLKLLLDQC